MSDYWYWYYLIFILYEFKIGGCGADNTYPQWQYLPVPLVIRPAARARGGRDPWPGRVCLMAEGGGGYIGGGGGVSVVSGAVVSDLTGREAQQDVHYSHLPSYFIISPCIKCYPLGPGQASVSKEN